MAKTRKDKKGRALRKGESVRSMDGLYVYKYTDWLGKSRFVYSKDLGRLREKEQELQRDQLDGLDTYTKGTASLNFVFDRYLKYKTELRKTTYSAYKYTYDHYVRETFGKKKIADIKYSDVLQFYLHMMTDHGLSLAMIDAIHCLLHPTFQLAVRDDIIRKNPSDRVMTEIKKKYNGEPEIRHALTREQQDAFLSALDCTENFRWKPIFTVLLGTGCRVGEVIGLRWSDINFETKMIDINHAISYFCRRDSTTKCEFGVSLPKTKAGIRSIPMLPEVYEAFMDEKKIQQDLGIKCTFEIDGFTDFIFCNRFGGIHNPNALNRVIQRICEDYNSREEVRAQKEKREPILLPHFTCHHLRHTFCSRYCENETNIKVIQTVMGHADIATTMNIYAEVNEKSKKESFENLAKNLFVFSNGKE